MLPIALAEVVASESEVAPGQVGVQRERTLRVPQGERQRGIHASDGVLVG